MKMITVKRTIPTATLPSGNPFLVYPPEDLLIGWLTAPIWTGLSFDLPEDVMFQAFPLIKNLVVVGCGQSERGLHIAVMCVDGEVELKSHIPFASVSMVKREAVPVRFIETDGKIVIAPPDDVKEDAPEMPKKDEDGTIWPFTPLPVVPIQPIIYPDPFQPQKNSVPWTSTKNPWNMKSWTGTQTART